MSDGKWVNATARKGENNEYFLNNVHSIPETYKYFTFTFDIKEYFEKHTRKWSGWL